MWSALLAKTGGTNFDASVSVLRSLVLMLKTTPFCCESWGEETWSTIEYAMAMAANAEDSTGQAQTALVDEIDKTAALIESRCNRPPLRSHWSANMQAREQGPCKNGPSSFLAYAISNGLALYVKAKIGHRIHEADHESDRPLLDYATFHLTIHRLKRLEKLHPPMLALLLQGGLDPNLHHQSPSPWKKVLSHIYARSTEVSESTEVLDPSWLEVCKLFVLHNAHTWLRCLPFDANPVIRASQEGQFPKRSPLEIVNIAFSHLPYDSVEELRAMMVKSSGFLNSSGAASSRKRRRDSRKKTLIPRRHPLLTKSCYSSNFRRGGCLQDSPSTRYAYISESAIPRLSS